MDEAGIDVVIATSKHNVQYLLGGHRADFFDYMDATGVTPLFAGVGLSEGRAGKGRLYRSPAGEIPARGEADVDARNADQYRPVRSTRCRRRSTICARSASSRSASPPNSAFCRTMPRRCCAPPFPMREWVDALFVLERQRVKKSPEELSC